MYVGPHRHRSRFVGKGFPPWEGTLRKSPVVPVPGKDWNSAPHCDLCGPSSTRDGKILPSRTCAIGGVGDYDPAHRGALAGRSTSSRYVGFVEYLVCYLRLVEYQTWNRNVIHRLPVCLYCSVLFRLLLRLPGVVLPCFICLRCLCLPFAFALHCLFASLSAIFDPGF